MMPACIDTKVSKPPASCHLPVRRSLCGYGVSCRERVYIDAPPCEMRSVNAWGVAQGGACAHRRPSRPKCTRCTHAISDRGGEVSLAIYTHAGRRTLRDCPMSRVILACKHDQVSAHTAPPFARYQLWRYVAYCAGRRLRIDGRPPPGRFTRSTCGVSHRERGRKEGLSNLRFTERRRSLVLLSCHAPRRPL